MSNLWKREPREQVPVDPSKVYAIGKNSDDVRLSIEDQRDKASGRSWQYCCISFGEHSPDTPDECMESWPRTAIAQARKLIDELEQSLAATVADTNSVNDA